MTTLSKSILYYVITNGIYFYCSTFRYGCVWVYSAYVIIRKPSSGILLVAYVEKTGTKCRQYAKAKSPTIMFLCHRFIFISLDLQLTGLIN